jgi:hypothetical protein
MQAFLLQITVQENSLHCHNLNKLAEVNIYSIISFEKYLVQNQLCCYHEADFVFKYN